jgi:hypothetical protein
VYFWYWHSGDSPMPPEVMVPADVVYTPLAVVEVVYKDCDVCIDEWTEVCDDEWLLE